MRPIKLLEKLRFFSPSLVNKILQITNNTIRTDEDFMNFWWQLVREDKILLSIREAYNIYYYLTEVKPQGGAVAELGVYKGGASKLIAEFKAEERPLHLFDTFQGMPAVNKAIDRHHKGDFDDTSLEEVKEYLENYNDCYFHAGFFPETTKAIEDETEFCFVHLDVDIYKSTLAGLEYFYPRLMKGGILISHDYNSISCPGVKKAFDEYFKNLDEEIHCLWDTQCMVKKKA